MNPELLQLFQQHGIQPSALLLHGPTMIQPNLAATQTAPTVPVQGAAPAAGPSQLPGLLSMASQIFNQQKPQPQQLQAPQIHVTPAVPSLWDALGIHPSLAGLLGAH